MLYDYLIENYKSYEPIFTSDIDLGIPGNSLRPKLKALVDAGKLCRYDVKGTMQQVFTCCIFMQKIIFRPYRLGVVQWG